jgi:hypothetical protein
MPLSDMHQRKKGKNYAMLAALLAFIAVVFFVTIIRMKGG